MTTHASHYVQSWSQFSSLAASWAAVLTGSKPLDDPGFGVEAAGDRLAGAEDSAARPRGQPSYNLLAGYTCRDGRVYAVGKASILSNH